MNKNWIILLGLFVIISSCAPKISTSIYKKYEALEYTEDVMIFGMEDTEPENAEQLGTVKIGDTGFSTGCSFETVLEKAKIEARRIGGNAIKITEHTPPSTWGSSCHRIKANILRIENIKDYAVTAMSYNNSLVDADFALLHVYRPGGPGALISFDLHLGDTVIGRVSNNWKETIKIDRDGFNTLWVRTETKTELSIHIQLGNEYYIRCSMGMGVFVGRPQLEIVENTIGRMEFQAVAQKKNKK